MLNHIYGVIDTPDVIMFEVLYFLDVFFLTAKKILIDRMEKVQKDLTNTTKKTIRKSLIIYIRPSFFVRDNFEMCIPSFIPNLVSAPIYI